MQVEPIAQLFEYASLMSGLTYSDLEAKLKQARGLTGENPIFKAVSAKYPDIEEASFVDSVNESLRNGDFLLAIAGDGIRSDLHALRNLLANQGGLLARLSLLKRSTQEASNRIRPGSLDTQQWISSTLLLTQQLPRGFPISRIPAPRLTIWHGFCFVDRE